MRFSPSPNKDACLSPKTPRHTLYLQSCGRGSWASADTSFLPRANRRVRIICRTQHSPCTSPSQTAARAGDVNIRPWQAFLAPAAALRSTATFLCHIDAVGNGECDESGRRRGAKRATARVARAMVTAMTRQSTLGGRGEGGG